MKKYESGMWERLPVLPQLATWQPTRVQPERPRRVEPLVLWTSLPARAAWIETARILGESVWAFVAIRSTRFVEATNLSSPWLPEGPGLLPDRRPLLSSPGIMSAPSLEACRLWFLYLHLRMKPQPGGSLIGIPDSLENACFRHARQTQVPISRIQ